MTYVVQDGGRQSPPLVLLHGSGAASGCWDPMIPVLAAHRHVIRIDLPGCGHSPPARSYAVPDQAAAVAAVLDDLGLDRVAVAGHSSGGYVATALAERRPDLVRSIAVIDSGPGLDALRPQPPAVRALLGPPLGPLVWAVRSDAWVRAGIRTTAARPIDVPASLIAAVRGLTYRTMRSVLRANAAYLAERPLPERLAALGVPVLVVFGEAEPRYEPSSFRRYEAVPGVRIEALPGVGHLPPLEAPAATSALLLGLPA